MKETEPAAPGFQLLEGLAGSISASSFKPTLET
jgi:hypothetical protein